jgi:hypothetical protein
MGCVTARSLPVLWAVDGPIGRIRWLMAQVDDSCPPGPGPSSRAIRGLAVTRERAGWLPRQDHSRLESRELWARTEIHCACSLPISSSIRSARWARLSSVSP